MSSIRSIVIIISAFHLITAVDCYSQEVEQGTIPQLIISHAISNEVSVRSSLASRQTFNSENSTSGFDYVLTDWTNLISLKKGIDYSIQIGYLLRLEEGQQVHRSIQRASFASPLNVGRIAHRIGLDQTFASNDTPVFRARYRLGYEGPLNGLKINAQEFYLKLNIEGLYKYQSGNGKIEFRAIPFLGYEFARSSRIELGPDYRIDDIRIQRSAKTLWWTINYYIRI